MRIVVNEARCPCTSGSIFGECCGPILGGARPAATAEELMRSRFTAFAVGDRDYLLATWDSEGRPADLTLDETLNWYRLDVESCVAGGPFDVTGTVTFTAYYRDGADRGSMVEHSRFVRRSGQWRYVDGSPPVDR